jgi:dTDP-4-amino-4,6-dideoxygalactose transaminase
MLLPRTSGPLAPFPFSDPHVQFVYLARNAIFGLAHHFKLRAQEVLFPAYFHGVELEALLAAGVRLRFYRVRSDMQVDPDDVVREVRPATRAVYLIHYLGFPGPVEALRSVCADRGLVLIEDCALALLSRLGSQPLGTFGDAAVFCLYKSLPVPDGGAVVLRQGRLGLNGTVPGVAPTTVRTIAALLHTSDVHGGLGAQRFTTILRGAGKPLTRAAHRQRVATGTEHFDLTTARLLMSRVSRVILARQDFDLVVETRRRNYLQLLDGLRDVAVPLFDRLPAGVCPLFYPFVTNEKQRVWRELRERGVEAVDFWRTGRPALPPGVFPAVDAMRATVLELPCHQDLTPAAVERLIHVVRTVTRE